MLKVYLGVDWCVVHHTGCTSKRRGTRKPTESSARGVRRPYFWVTQLWGCHAGVDDPRTDMNANDSNALFYRWPCRIRLRAGPSVCSDISSGPPTTFHWALAKGPNRFQNRKICTHTEGAKEPPGTHRKPKGVPRKGGEYAILTRPHCALPTGSTEFTFFFFLFSYIYRGPSTPLKGLRMGDLGLGI